MEMRYESGGSSSRIFRVSGHISQSSVWVKNNNRTRRVIAANASRSRSWSFGEIRANVRTLYLKRSSNAWRALVGPAVPVWRSTVVRAEKKVQVFRASFGATRTVIGWVHSNRALVSNETHWMQL